MIFFGQYFLRDSSTHRTMECIMLMACWGSYSFLARGRICEVKKQMEIVWSIMATKKHSENVFRPVRIQWLMDDPCYQVPGPNRSRPRRPGAQGISAPLHAVMHPYAETAHNHLISVNVLRQLAHNYFPLLASSGYKLIGDSRHHNVALESQVSQ